MFERHQILCLRTVPYSDSAAVMSGYSRQTGRVSLHVPLGASRGARRIRALTMPMSMVECMVDVRPGRNIYQMRDVMPWGAPSPAAEGNPAKMAIGVFLADLLGALLRESMPDALTFDFIRDALEALATMKRGEGNFHLAFIYKLSRFLGIEPDMGTWRPGRMFDFRDGMFRDMAPLHGQYLTEHDSRIVAALARMTWGNLCRFRLNHLERNAILDAELKYLSMHVAPVGELPSLAVVRSLF